MATGEHTAADEILEVDLLRFERGDANARRAIVDGVMRSLRTGFVYTAHDLSEDMLDTAYAMLQQFYALPVETKQSFVAPGTNGQTGYTGLLVETAAIADKPDWKEMLNWGREIPLGHPLQTRFPSSYPRQVLPESAVPGITKVLSEFHDRVLDVQRRFLHIIALGLGCHEDFFEMMLHNGSTLTRSIHYPSMANVPGEGHVWAAEHGDINLITALPRATTRGLQVKLANGEWVDAYAPAGQVIINTGMMLEQLTNGVIRTGPHRVVALPGQNEDRYSVVQFCHPTPWTVLAPIASCVNEANPQRFPAIAAADKLSEVIWSINLTEGARRIAD
jgi:isopenicillin N synthase-like dioxygenase